jgi:Holliday junction resolvase RusA-like endonuclease
MPRRVSFFVPGLPVAQPRQRTRVRPGKQGGFIAQNYTPSASPVNAFKAAVALMASSSWTGGPIDGPVKLDLEFVFPRPRNLFWKSKAMPRLRHSKKPDRDNLEKALMDALKGITWIDDAQVCDGSVRKWIASGEEKPGVEVTITELEP